MIARHLRAQHIHRTVDMTTIGSIPQIAAHTADLARQCRTAGSMIVIGAAMMIQITIRAACIMMLTMTTLALAIQAVTASGAVAVSMADSEAQVIKQRTRHRSICVKVVSDFIGRFDRRRHAAMAYGQFRHPVLHNQVLEP